MQLNQLDDAWLARKNQQILYAKPEYQRKIQQSLTYVYASVKHELTTMIKEAQYTHFIKLANHKEAHDYKVYGQVKMFDDENKLAHYIGNYKYAVYLTGWQISMMTNKCLKLVGNLKSASLSKHLLADSQIFSKKEPTFYDIIKALKTILSDINEEIFQF